MSRFIAAGDITSSQMRRILADLDEGIILLEADGRISWSNAAALVMHGVSTAAQLGADVADYRSRFDLRYRNNHRLEQGQYPIERAAAGEEFSGIVVAVRPQSASDARWTHEARSLILSDGVSGAGWAILFLLDKTEEVSAEERFERAFASNPAPAVICRLSDLRHIKVNQGFLDMTGYARDQVIGRSVYDRDVLEGADEKARHVELLHDGVTIPQTEAALRAADGSHRPVIVAGQPIEMRNERCMLFTFIDLEHRKRAEDELRQSQERIAKAFHLSPLPTAVMTLDDCRFQDANEAFLAAFGFTREEITGQRAANLKFWVDDRDYLRHIHELQQNNHVTNQEIRVRAKDGSILDCLLSAHTFTVGGRSCVLSVLQDSTERKRTTAELIGALDSVMQDTTWFSRTVIEKLAQLRHPASSGNSGAGLADLTRREVTVLGLMCQALADRAIADRLRISPNTVRNHVGMIYRKINVHSRSAAIVWARDRGISGDATEFPQAAKTTLGASLPRPRLAPPGRQK